MALNDHDAGGASGGAERDPRIERLYREAARETPPAHLDAAILAAARREVGARPRSLASALRRWHVPVSVAAVVVVSVTLVILVREEEMAERSIPAPVPAAATPAAEQAAAPQTPPAPAEAARETAQLRRAAPAPQRQELRDEMTFSTTPGKQEDRSRAASPGLPEERAAPASSDTVVAGPLQESPAAANGLRSARPEADAAPAGPVARVMAAKAAGEDRRPPWDGLEKEPPEKWLVRIEELKRQGRSAEAEEMLSEFKRRFPEHPRAAAPR